MNRTEWAFQFEGWELRDAAAAKVAHHTERLAWWTAEHDTAEAALRERGVEFREYQQTGGSRLDVVIDPDLSRRLAECKGKIDYHRDTVRDFAMYVSLFKRNESETFGVSPHDVKYFGIFGSE